MRCLAEIVFIPTLADRAVVALPASLSFLCYPLRPLRLSCKWPRQFFSHSLRSGMAPL